MNKKLTLITAGVLALLGSAAVADDHHDSLDTAIARGRADISVQEVIDKVTAESKGRVVEVHFEEMDSPLTFGDGPMVYEAHTVAPDGVVEYHVDPKDGHIISSRKERLGDFHFKSMPESMELTLKEAVHKAKQASSGEVVSARLEMEDGAFLYEITLYDSGAYRTLAIDPLNGNILPPSSRHSHDEGNDEGHES